MNANHLHSRSFFPSLRSSLLAAASIAAWLMSPATSAGALAQAPSTVPTPPPQTQTSTDGSNTTTTTTTVDSTGKQVQSVTTSHTFGRGKKKTAKEDKVVQSKATRKAVKKDQKLDALAGVDSKLPDKQLYDKAVAATKKGHYDVARLDLQTMLNTYPDSQYQMRAKLAIADSWYKEGGTAALTQAESEYADFRVFFPNVPEAAEAQMRIGDIYFRQMDKPDRDYAKALHAEEEYRRMLTDYPDSTLIPQAKQRLREVQEVLATREADIASYYATRENWAAVIARYQTVVDTFPLFSHMDDTLIGLGDAYEAQARYVRTMKLAEGPKARLESLYDGLAAEQYRKVVLDHSASLHVEDARDRLDAMHLPIPVPSKEQVAASEALENSRRTYRLSDRAKFMILHTPDTVLAAQLGDPSLTDAKPTYAPSIRKKVEGDFATAFNGGAPSPAAPVSSAPANTPSEASAPAVAAPAAPLAFQEVTAGDAGGGATDMAPATSSPSSTGSGLGVEILNSPARPARSLAPPADGNYGLKAVGPVNASALPAPEAPAAAPDRPNEVSAATPAAQALPEKGKLKKPEFDKSDESSSKHKKKKGLKKIIPPNPL